ncbi:butyrate kinase [Granulicatella balaenopterae]|uniref:Probable butyrate kinase n=1 Tax=Granulicatella balaenopterae TaxID=137733 RepID=A0A1H9HE58_9LACT|nr:butyrate kinase [Granulicatella balaenopterae]SEQ60552.1 butyrate kinase [Granulicatella balaenopterae]
MQKIVVINPGATSTKLAYFEDESLIWKDEIVYTSEQLGNFDKIFDQLALRTLDVETCLLKHDIPADLDTVVGRGGLIGPVKSGAIVVDDFLIDRLKNKPVLEHASNLGCKLADDIVKKFGKVNAKAYIYDPVTVDSMCDIARITGLAEVQRTSVGHHLNMRAVAMKAAKDINQTYQSANIIVVHMGGGCSASAHKHGEVIDFVSDDEIMFSAERSGGLPIKEMIPILKRISVEEFTMKVRKNAGLQSHFGTKDLRIIEGYLEKGDEHAKLVLEAMALGISKCMASLAATLEGKVDAVCLTGGMAYSDFLCAEVAKRTTFIAPFIAYPGEFELQALASGGYRVLTQQEEPYYLEDIM